MPEYISRYINLSASRWFPRRIQEVISGTSMRSPVGSLARALSRERERERASSRGGGNGSSSNQPCAIRTCTPFEWQRERREYSMYERKEDDWREKVKQERERERDSRVGCGTHPRGGGGGGGNSRLVNAVAMEGGEEKDRERKSSSFVCGGSRVACGLRILHGTWLAHPPPSTRFIQRLCHSHVTTPLRVPENTPLYFTFQPLAAVVYAFPSSVSLRNRCNFFLTAVLKHFYRVGGSFVFSPSWWRNRSVK